MINSQFENFKESLINLILIYFKIIKLIKFTSVDLVIIPALVLYPKPNPSIIPAPIA